MNSTPKFNKMVSKAGNAMKRLIVPFGKIASGNSKKVNIQNTANGEVREAKIIAPYGISYGPPTGLFAQMSVNGESNNTCIGVHNPHAPNAIPGEIIIYSSAGTQIKVSPNGTISISGAVVSISGTTVKINGSESVNITGGRINIG